MITSERINELMLEAEKSVQFLSNSNKSKRMLILNRFNELFNAEVSKHTLTKDNDMDIIDVVNNQLDKLVERFDYSTVHTYMTNVGWHWASEGGTPTIHQMQSTNLYYLHMVYDQAHKKSIDKPNKKKVTARTTTGGFEYECTIFRDTPKPYFTMKFIIADWSSIYD
jgi:hypothetical protein